MRSHIVGVIALAGALAGCGEGASPAPSTSTHPAVSVDQATLDAAVAATVPATPPEPETTWTYDSSKDEMRGTTSHFARVSSDNTINLGFPYDAEPAHLTIRKRPSDGLSVMLNAPGQFMCNSYNDDAVAVKFDDGPVQRFTCSEPDSSATGLLFINSEARFVERLKKAKRVIIEAQMFQAGPQQMTFTVEGLDWPPKPESAG